MITIIMNLKTPILTLIVLATCLTSCAPKAKLTKLDQSLTRNYVTMMEASPEIRFDSLAPLFKNRLKTELTKPGTLKYPFDSLSEKLFNVTTDDGKFRIFSWDEQDTGNWHHIAVFGQFKTETGRVAVQELSPFSVDEMEGGGYSDSYTYEIHTLTIDGKPHYLALGSGTHGSGFKHQVVQIFKIEGDSLTRCGSCFEEGSRSFGTEKYSYDYLVIEVRRGDYIDLKFNSETNEITFNEYVYPDYSYAKEPQINATTLKLVDGVFKTVSSVKLSDEQVKDLQEKEKPAVDW
ncbi:hypothetical protein [Sinomicrobium pectinilyticum]|uniref:Lipoprotein n=1 Tax=Sinomicrobium pectinilyticum TaxID=1084421 RepID=A0A3N0DQX0_SINP1|nr:hypothetical protein [Sinomicrobium pectinilyticum]RNL78035.1 hypothetical protein ED312_20010 [Sinomicrobium pectinilyticum]